MVVYANNIMPLKKSENHSCCQFNWFGSVQKQKFQFNSNNYNAKKDIGNTNFTLYSPLIQ
jgi:hypothetical protein